MVKKHSWKFIGGIYLPQNLFQTCTKQCFMDWECIGDELEMHFQEYIENALGTIGDKLQLERFWGCIRNALGMHWECIGNVLGNALEMYWECIGDVLGMFYGCIENALRMHWECIENASGTHWECIWDAFGTHEGTLGMHWGHIRDAVLEFCGALLGFSNVFFTTSLTYFALIP